MNYEVRTASDLIEEYYTLRWQRRFFESTWQDIVDNLLPNLAGFTTERPLKGQRWDESITEGSPRYALATFQAGLMGRLMSATADWFSFSAPDEDMMDDRDIRMWLSKASQTVFSLINGSQFYGEVYKLFGVAGGLGTATMYRYFDRNLRKEVFNLRNPREIFLADNDQAETDIVYRVTFMEAKQIVQAFKDDNLAPQIIAAAVNPSQMHTEYRVLHAVRPNPDWDPRKRDKRVKRYKSWYLDIEHNVIIREGGYDAFPYAVWAIEKEVTEAYGRGPGWRALADVKQFYAMNKSGTTQVQMLGNPPLEIPEERRGLVKWVPGGRNYYEDAGRRIFKGDVATDLKGTYDILQRKQAIIEKHFMVPFFTAMQQAQAGGDVQRTAYEVRQIEQEMAILLGPYAMGFQSQFMDNVASGVLSDALENNLLAPPPPKLVQGLNGRKLESIYSGPLAQAQKAFFNTEPYRKTLQDIQLIMGTDPTGQSLPRQIFDIPDWDKFFRRMAEGNGLPEEGLKEVRAIMAKRQADQKQAQQNAKLAQLQAAAKAAPGLNEAPQPGSPAEAMNKQGAPAAPQQ